MSRTEARRFGPDDPLNRAPGTIRHPAARYRDGHVGVKVAACRSRVAAQPSAVCLPFVAPVDVGPALCPPKTPQCPSSDTEASSSRTGAHHRQRYERHRDRTAMAGGPRSKLPNVASVCGSASGAIGRADPVNWVVDRPHHQDVASLIAWTPLQDSG